MSMKKQPPRQSSAVEVERDKIIKALEPHLKRVRGEHLIFGTLVDPKRQVKKGKLKASDADRISAQVQKSMRKVQGMVRAVISAELVLNVIENRCRRWTPHVHLAVVVRASDWATAKNAVAEVLKCENAKAAGIYRPLVLKPIADVKKVLGYMTKSVEAGSTIRRSSWTDSNGRRHTKRQALATSERAEVDATWGKLSLSQRLTRVGFPISGGGVVGTPKPKKAKKRGAVNSERGGELVRSGVRKSSKKTVKSEG